MRLRIVKFGLLGLFLLAAATGCDGCGGEPEEEPQVGRSQAELDLENAKRFLTNFEGKRAGDNYRIFMNQRRYQDPQRRDAHYCEALYGAMLGDVQHVNKLANNLVAQLVSLAFSGFGAPPEPGQESYQTSASYQPANTEADLGWFLANGWGAIDTVLGRIGEYASEVTTYEESIPECGFSIGVEEGIETEFNWIYPLRFGDDRVPIIELQFQGRMDGAEARVLGLFARSLRSAADFILAHDMSMTIDLAKFATLVGMDQGCLAVRGFECLDELGTPRDLRGISFLFEDNHNLLAKSETRWSRMERIDNEMIPAFFGMRTFFNSLSVRDRTVRETRAITADEVLDQFFIVYQDRNQDGVVDPGDFLGINIKGIKCDATTLVRLASLDAEAEANARDMCQTIETLSTTIILPMLRSLGAPSQAVLDEVNLFVDRMYGAMRSVEDPGYPYDFVPINSFDNTLEYLFRIGLFDERTPNWLTMDFGSFLTDPKPLREFLPYWTSTSTQTGSRFLMDSDDYTDGVTIFTLPEYYLDGAFLESKPDPMLVEERGLFLDGAYESAYHGPFNVDPIPADCLNIITTEEITPLGMPVMAFAMQDPTFNGLLHVNLGAWSDIYRDHLEFTNPAPSGNTLQCNDDDIHRWDPATNYNLTKGMWIYFTHLLESFALAEAL